LLGLSCFLSLKHGSHGPILATSTQKCCQLWPGLFAGGVVQVLTAAALLSYFAFALKSSCFFGSTMSEVAANWTSVTSSAGGNRNRVFQRIEIYSSLVDSSAANTSVGSSFVSAQFGGNILNVQDGFVVLQKASGKRKGYFRFAKQFCYMALAQYFSFFPVAVEERAHRQLRLVQPRRGRFCHRGRKRSCLRHVRGAQEELRHGTGGQGPQGSRCEDFSD
jgi:hypothetical protein